MGFAFSGRTKSCPGISRFLWYYSNTAFGLWKTNSTLLINFNVIRLHCPRLLKLTWCSLLLFVLQVSVLYGQNKTATEYQVKAVFLFNFTQFVEWPAATF